MGQSEFTEDIELTGRNVKEIQTHNAIAIRDTANYEVTIDVSELNRKGLMVQNSLNQGVTVTLLGYAKDGISAYILFGTKALAASTSGFITTTDIPALNEPIQKLRVRLSCATAPASGSISAFLEGVLN